MEFNNLNKLKDALTELKKFEKEDKGLKRNFK